MYLPWLLPGGLYVGQKPSVKTHLCCYQGWNSGTTTHYLFSLFINSDALSKTFQTWKKKVVSANPGSLPPPSWNFFFYKDSPSSSRTPKQGYNIEISFFFFLLKKIYGNRLEKYKGWNKGRVQTQGHFSRGYRLALNASPNKKKKTVLKNCLLAYIAYYMMPTGAFMYLIYMCEGFFSLSWTSVNIFQSKIVCSFLATSKKYAILR